MKKRREFLDYVADIQEAARHIEQFIAGMTWVQSSDPCAGENVECPRFPGPCSHWQVR
jgi:hypothetical protein